MLGVFRLPAALVAAVKGLRSRLLGTALGAELALVGGAAAALPTLLRLLAAALGAEVAGGLGAAAGAGPSVSRRLGSRRGSGSGGLVGGTHILLEQALHIASTDGASHIHARKGHHGPRGRIFGSSLHGIGGGIHHSACGCVAAAQEGRLLHGFQPLLVLFRSTDGGHTKGHDFNAPLLPPLGREHLIEGIGNIHGMQGQLCIADAHGGNLSESRLQGGHQFRTKHGIQPIPAKLAIHVAADILIEQNGVTDPVGVFTEATNGNSGAETDVLVHHPEGHRRGGAVLVAKEFLCINIVDSLILARIAAESKAAAHGGKGILHRLAQGTGEHAGFCRGIVDKLTGLGTDFRHLSLVNDQHTLAVSHGNDGAIGNDIVASPIGRPGGDFFLPLYRQDRLRQCVTIKILLPLVAQYTTGRCQCSFDQAHGNLSFDSEIQFRSPARGPFLVCLFYQRHSLKSSVFCKKCSFFPEVPPGAD